MKNFRTLAAAAASVVVAGLLLATLAGPAEASPANFPPIPGPIGPIYTGPAVPPIVSGVDRRPAVVFPSCDNVLAHAPGRPFAADPSVTLAPYPSPVYDVAVASRSLTCEWSVGRDGLVAISFKAISAKDFGTINRYYRHDGYAFAMVPGGGARPGSSSDLHIYDNDPRAGFPVDTQHFISPDGWWVAVVVWGVPGSATHYIDEATRNLLALNPLRS